MYFVNSDYQLADLFTKAIDEKRFTFLVEKIGMLNLELVAEALRCLTELLLGITEPLLYISFIVFPR